MNPFLKALVVFAWLATCLAGALLFSLLRLPVPWLLGAMLGSMTIRAFLVPPENTARLGSKLGQLIIGVVMGSRFSTEALRAGMDHIVPLLALIALTAVLCLINAVLLQRWAGVDKTTAFLGTLPGAAASVVAMSAELNVDRFMVTVLMYVRVVLVITLTPVMLSGLLHANTIGAEAVVQETVFQVYPLMLPVTGLTALTAAWVAHRIRVPSPCFMGPFVVVMLLAMIFPDTKLGLPPPMFAVGLLLLGGGIGVQIDVKRIRYCWWPTLVQAGLVVGLLLACMTAGYLFHRFTGIDMATAVLGMMPGGKEAMIAMSMAIGGNVEMVLTMQTVRWLLILFFGPPLALWMANAGKR